jgi:hypothetical protein
MSKNSTFLFGKSIVFFANLLSFIGALLLCFAYYSNGKFGEIEFFGHRIHEAAWLSATAFFITAAFLHLKRLFADA